MGKLIQLKRYNPGHWPPATVAVVGTLVAISVVDLALDGLLERALCGRGLELYHGQWWRVLTANLVHADLLHILFNAWGISILGSTLERLHGWRPLLAVVVAGALGGSGLALAMMDPAVRLVGSSTSSYALLGAVLGYFYVKTGSLAALWQVPHSRQLLIWFAFGVYMSLQPGVSLLGHLGGFVPGVVLGIYFELHYQRRADLWARLGVAVVAFSCAAVCVYACLPWHRPAFVGVRAMQAWEAGEMAEGDALLQRARKVDSGRHPGASEFLDFLRLWRETVPGLPTEEDLALLRVPLLRVQHEAEAGYDPLLPGNAGGAPQP
ncbi:MAG: rhomboid family intramembrane serine protease [Planctomycetes bacterium]|nr:rhomboid family intramembrane serine protease [Planctomycetota bacterium]